MLWILFACGGTICDEAEFEAQAAEVYCETLDDCRGVDVEVCANEQGYDLECSSGYVYDPTAAKEVLDRIQEVSDCKMGLRAVVEKAGPPCVDEDHASTCD